MARQRGVWNSRRLEPWKREDREQREGAVIGLRVPPSAFFFFFFFFRGCGCRWTTGKTAVELALWGPPAGAHGEDELGAIAWCTGLWGRPRTSRCGGAAGGGKVPVAPLVGRVFFAGCSDRTDSAASLDQATDDAADVI